MGWGGPFEGTGGGWAVGTGGALGGAVTAGLAAAPAAAEAGVGAYPPLFVGRLVQALEVPGT